MSCLVNRIPEILNIEGIRKDKRLIDYFKTIPKLDQQTIRNISQDFYTTLGINDPLLEIFINDAIQNINNNKNMFTTLADTSQCTIAIGPEQFGDTCYLCGLPLLPRGPRGIGNDTSDPLYPECEHVLPYIYGALYLNLVTSRKEFDSLQLAVQQLSRIEYKWAHKCCNQLKSQAPFVKYTNDFQFKEDEVNLKCFLNELYEGNGSWATQFQDAVAIIFSSTGEKNNQKFKKDMSKQKALHLPVLKKTITDIVNKVSSLVDGEVNFLRSIMIISFLKYIKQTYTKNNKDLTALKKSITPGVRSYILKSWNIYRQTFQSLVQDTNRLTDEQIFSTYLDSEAFAFGKTNKLSSMSNQELKTKLHSIGINVTKLNSKGKRLNLTRKELERKATMFKNLQIRAKKMGIKLMYKSKTRGYTYKTYNRLMNELEKLKQMKNSMKFG